jgi:glyceraldehyde 3-phosphate dehydrogenase
MPLKIGINGFGRIGRLFFRAAVADKNIEIVGVNDIVPPDNLAYLLKHDSTHGRFDGSVEAKENGIMVNGKLVPTFAIKNPAELPWNKQAADYVIESTGLFTDFAGAENHLKAGAKRVIISAPTKDPEKVPTLLIGVNHTKFDANTVANDAGHLVGIDVRRTKCADASLVDLDALGRTDAHAFATATAHVAESSFLQRARRA